MKKSNCISVAVINLILLFALAPVHAQDVDPTSHDFGDVTVGESVSTIVTLSNDGFDQIMINSITLSGSGDFSQTSGILFPISLPPGDFIYVEVTFTPSAVGEFSADLVIQNGDQFVVPFSGTGVAELPPPTITIGDIIVFINVSVSNGTLEGAGSGNSADGRLNALINMLNRASNLINTGDYEAACGQLSAALKRCDDFVQGTAQNDLKQMISELMNDLGC